VRAKQHLMDSLARGVNSPQLLAGDEEGAAFEDCLIDGLLGELREPRPPESAPARWKIARRAAGYLHEHCREELHVGDICRATGASRRTLHLGFMELYGVGPMGYLRILRLNGARRELQGARLHGRSVTSVATSWGFTHLSRFAGAYRAHFGVLPSVDVAARDKGR
jgi:AraC family ethanolamine operon transcriptional activator